MYIFLNVKKILASRVQMAVFKVFFWLNMYNFYKHNIVLISLLINYFVFLCYLIMSNCFINFFFSSKKF